jgi:pyridoxine 5-phosphate synthase
LQREEILQALRPAASYGAASGLEIHAGHGLTYDSVAPIASIPEIRELNIGHFLVGEAIFVGLEQSIRQMRDLMNEARKAGVS